MPKITSKFSDLYHLREQLGKGAFSVVYRCVDRTTNKQYAVKVIKKENLNRRGLMKLEEEARICGKLDHPNIVKLHAIVNEPKVDYFVFDLVTGGELFHDIVKNTNYTEELTAKFMEQVFKAVNYVHHVGVVHRDLKPENILLENTQSKVIKLADFGLAVEVRENEEKWFGMAGTALYMAPEVLEMKPYGRPVDMWACGVIMYILLVGYPPFNHHSEWRLHAMIKSGDYEMSSEPWTSVSVDAKDLISGLMCIVPSRRYTAAQALAHPWFQSAKHVETTRRDTVEKLRVFNAKRKFRAAIRTVHMVKTLKPSMHLSKQVQQSSSKPSSSSSSKSSARSQSKT